MSPLDPLADSSDAQASSRTTTPPLAAEATNTVTPVWSGVDSAADASSLKRPEDFLHRPRTRGPKTRRARWGSVNLIHAVFEDGFPDLEERYVREKAAADRRYEYNLGSRTFDTEEDGDDGLEHLKKLFRTLDRAAGNPATDDDDLARARRKFAAELRLWGFRKGARKRRRDGSLYGDPETMSDCDGPAVRKRPEPGPEHDVPPGQVGGAGRLVLLARAAGSRPRAKQAYTLADPDFNKQSKEPTSRANDRPGGAHPLHPGA
ncbi:hypothetical protein SO694_00025274 [Aureococcus anophagefferens]|uniref:Uncharacterized protein n=1 Tax=Aureococcus anophagefferens TaxID=44056 RepID=A0ABR1FVD8_AURAN|mmetsp:Transcript_29606/g.95888  ORF Transcript_29606/g.95888 Transcript_29606/m.95888 type:complete len:262 (-) Transcript_29606:31-816(-)